MNRFKSFCTNVTQKVSTVLKEININPINMFIKDSLDKILSDIIIEPRIQIEDIRKGTIALQQLQLNTQKINRKHLFSSPYILHHGSINKLRLSLPSIRQLQTTSFSIQIEDIYVQLKPQSNFAENFKTIIQQIRQQIRLNGGDDQSQNQPMACQHDPRDYFKKLIKTMFRNLKVKVKNIVVGVYLQDPFMVMNKPTNNTMLMFRIPLINIHRGGQGSLKQQLQDHRLEVVNFEIELPQFTVHLLNDQIISKNQGFPFTYPRLKHPGTILLFGQDEFDEIEIQKDENITRASIVINTNYEKGEKDFNITITASKLQAMINPQQVKLMLLFVAQIKHFGEQLQQIKKQLGLLPNSGENNSDASLSIPLTMMSRKSSNSKRRGQDLFGSMCISLWESGTITLSPHDHKGFSKRRAPDMMDTIIDQDSSIKKQIQQLNNQLQQQLFHSIGVNNMLQQQPQQGQHIFVISFKQFFTVNIKLDLIQLFVIKHLGSENEERSWQTNNSSFGNTQNNTYINTQIKQSYFMFSLTKTKLSLKQRDEEMEMQLEDVLVRHVKYVGCRNSKKEDNMKKESQQQSHVSVHQKKQDRIGSLESNELEFFDVQGSMDYYLMQEKEIELKEQQKSEVKNKDIKDSGHHCAEDVIRIAHKQPTHRHQSASQLHSIKLNSFHPQLYNQDGEKSESMQIYKPGVLIAKKQADKKCKLIVQLMHIQLSLGSEFLLQLFDFCSIVQYMLETTTNTNIDNDSNIENQHQQPIGKGKNISLQLTASTISAIIYESPLPQGFKSSVQKYNLQQQPNNSQSSMIQSSCFCSINSSTGCFLFLKSLAFQSQSTITKLSFRTLNIGILSIDHAQTLSHQSIILINQVQDVEHKRVKKFKLLLSQSDSNSHHHKVGVSLPLVEVNILEGSIINGLEMIKRQVDKFVPMIQKLFNQNNPSTKINEQQPVTMIKRNHLHHMHQQQQLPPTITKLNISLTSIRVNFLDLQLYLSNISVQKTTDQLLFHLSTIVISSTLNKRVYQTQMREFGKCDFTQIKSKSKDNNNNSIKQTQYPQIEDSSILIEINNPVFAPKITKKSKQKQRLLMKSSEQIIELQQQSCLLVKMTMGIQQNNKNNQSLKGKQSIGVTLLQNIYLNACNCLKVCDNKDSYQSFVHKVKGLVDGIVEGLSQTMQCEKKSKLIKQGIEQYKPQKVPIIPNHELNIFQGKLFIDIHPTFVSSLPEQQSIVSSNNDKNNQLKQQHQFQSSQILSNSRSVLQIQWQHISVGNFPNDNRRYTNCTVNLNYYFTRVATSSHQTLSNHNLNNSKLLHKPLSFILLSSKSLTQNGLFQQIFSLKSIKLSIQKTQHQINSNISIVEINSTTSFDTLAWVMLHWQHFLKHDVNKDYGMTVQQCDDMVVELKWEEDKLLSEENHSSLLLEQQNNNHDNNIPYEEQQIQDLTHAEFIYNEKLNHKKEIQQRFVKKQFTQPQPNKTMVFFIQNLSIQKVNVKLLYRTNARLQTSLQGIRAVVKVHEPKPSSPQSQTIQALLKLQQFQVILYQKYQQSSTIRGMLSNFWYKKQAQIFQIVKAHNPIKILVQTNQQNIMAKLDKVSLQLGFTSELLEVVDQWTKIDQHIKYSGWKKTYQSQEHSSDKNQHNIQTNNAQIKSLQRHLLIHCPKTSLNLTLVYEGLKILQQKRLDSPAFNLHEQISKPERIKSYVMRWVDSLIRNNIRGVIAVGMMNSFGSLVAQLLRFVKVLVSMLLSCLG